MNYVSARDGIPVPTKPYERAGRAEWVVCGCGHKGRPGAFHICVDLGTDEPVAAPKKKAAKKAKPRKRLAPVGSRVCECGKPKDRSSKRCHECRVSSYAKPECGTVEGYNWHRRQSVKNPGAHPWPLPKADPCGCRAAQAANSKRRRLQEKGEAA